MLYLWLSIQLGGRWQWLIGYSEVGIVMVVVVGTIVVHPTDHYSQGSNMAEERPDTGGRRNGRGLEAG